MNIVYVLGLICSQGFSECPTDDRHIGRVYGSYVTCERTRDQLNDHYNNVFLTWYCAPQTIIQEPAPASA